MKQNTNKFVLGTDPEGFYARTGDNGELTVIPPVDYRKKGFPVSYLDSDPNHKHPVFAREDGVNGPVLLIEDGCAWELTVAPSLSMKSLFQDIELGKKMAHNVAKQFGDFIAVVPTIGYDVNKYLEVAADPDYAMSLIFGCDPDRDVFQEFGHEYAECTEESALFHPYRYGGGHLHVSGCEEFQTKPLLAVKLFAFFIGTLVTAISPMHDLDFLRVYRYGRPGRFRIQKYGKLFKGIPFTDQGIEYRSPSNAWTTKYDMAEKIELSLRTLVEVIKSDEKIIGLVRDVEKDAITAVSTGNKELAAQVYSYCMGIA